MARISLILPLRPTRVPLSAERVARWRQELEAAGHQVEVVIATGPIALEVMAGPWRHVTSEAPDLASAAVAGLRACRGEVLLVADPAVDYATADFERLAAPLIEGRADLALASRFTRAGRARRHPVGRDRPDPASRDRGLPRDRFALGAAALARPLIGATDPFSGLVGLTREAFRQADATFTPVGPRFAGELLLKVKGRRIEVPVRTRRLAPRERLALDDFRQFKRLADYRFGNFSRLLQFCVVGASGVVVDLSCYALLQWLLASTWMARRTAPILGGSLDLAVAGALAIAIALSWNFSLNRRFTFSYARHGSLARQFVTYALSNALGIALSFSLRLTLPRFIPFFDAHKLTAALVGILAATGLNFTLSRWLVFTRESDLGPGAPPLAGPSPAP